MSSGLTWKRGSLLSLFAVLSISCKELTAPTYVLPYVGLAVTGWRRTDGDPAAAAPVLGRSGDHPRGRTDWYALVNIVYAPATWLADGPLALRAGQAIPNVWASPGYTASAYLLDTIGA